MKINREVLNDIVVLRLKGRMMGGPGDAGQFDKEFNDIIANGPRRVLIDLAGLTLINSTGLGILISNRTRLGNADGILKLVNVPKRIMSALQITWLDKEFEFFREEEEALASF